MNTTQGIQAASDILKGIELEIALLQDRVRFHVSLVSPSPLHYEAWYRNMVKVVRSQGGRNIVRVNPTSLSCCFNRTTISLGTRYHVSIIVSSPYLGRYDEKGISKVV